MAKIKGIDISFWQNKVDFKRVAASGIKFAILREGYRKTIDSRFLEYVKGCQDNNIYIMVYHFIYTDGATPKQNAQSTYDNIKKAGLDPSKTWIAADLEYDTWKKNGQKCTKAKCTQYTKEYFDALKELGCKKLFVYTNQDYYKNYYDWSQLKYPVWLADYKGDPNFPCAIQQYTNSGKVDGINGNVDMNYLFDASMLTIDNQSKIEKESEKNNTMAITADRVIKTAMAEKGYQQKKSNSSLDSKSANAGSNNYTKYARDFDTKYPRWYNGKKNGYAWCDMFVDWCFLTTFGYQKALELLCQPQRSAGAGCKYSYQYYKQKGRAGRVPKIGAQIFFGNSEQNLNHTGLVYDIDNTYVYTIEGNTSNKVDCCKYKRGASNLWYGYPKYDSDITSLPKETIKSEPIKPQTPSKEEDIDKIAKQVLDGKWGNGETRKNQLEKAGYNYNVIQTKVNELINLGANKAKSYNKDLKRTYITTAKLRLRKDASMSAPIITTMPKDTVITCLGFYTNDWYYVKYNNYYGFCYKNYLK